jgi:predicted metalloprotease with PDZ domain
MRYLNSTFAQKSKGFAPDDILAGFNLIAQSDFTLFFEKYIYGTVELPYKKAFAYAGMNVELKKAKMPFLGRLWTIGERNRVLGLQVGGALEKGGIRRGDFILAIDGLPMAGGEQIENYVLTKAIGDTIKLMVERSGITMSFKAIIDEQEKVNCKITPMKNTPPLRQSIRDDWLAGQLTNKNLE